MKTKKYLKKVMNFNIYYSVTKFYHKNIGIMGERRNAEVV